ncbi:hypothetical protein EDB19DRAFT_1912021 [Suillus lakei]|nr:hypothetical protein EDB19DRAFT_1912021 [Suillus lakei]
MRSFSTLALILPAVLAAPLKFTTHRYSPSSCVVAGIAYPNPRHALVLLGRRELSPPTGVSERAFTDFLLLCHESDGRSSSGSLVARQQGDYLSKAFGDPAGSDSTAATSTPTNSSTSGDQNAGSSAAQPSPTPASATPPAHAVPRSPFAVSPGDTPSEMSGSAVGPTTFETLTGTLAGNDAPGTPTDLAGSTPFENTAETTTPADSNASHDTNASETLQSDSSAFDTPFTATFQGPTTVDASSPFVESDTSGNISDAFDNLGDSAVLQEEEPVDFDAIGDV